MRKLVLVPIMDVVIEGSDDTTAPCKCHVILNGSSPFVMEQAICAKLPSSSVSLGNENGAIWGGSEK